MVILTKYDIGDTVQCTDNKFTTLIINGIRTCLDERGRSVKYICTDQNGYGRAFIEETLIKV